MDGTTVRIDEGFLKGLKKQSLRGGEYFSFQGIPYGKPPVGPLRFQPPQPVDNWDGVKSAESEGPSCPSIDIITGQFEENASEDCLYLNVYTPDMESAKLPVMFWIHGGGFQLGSSSEKLYGPDYLMTEKVILVTINYRLGALGFLSLESELCPGNNALRDVILGLKWVQRNIHVFGGDKSNVTIFGISAGGALASYILGSPKTHGLFHKAIVISGINANPWALASQPKKLAYALAEKCGLKAKNDEEVLEFLRTIPPNDLNKNAQHIQKIIDPNEKALFWLPFRPVIEPSHPNAVVDRPPSELVNLYPDIPMMFGTTDLESLFLLLDSEIKEMKEDDDYNFVISRVLNLPLGTSYKKEVIDKVKQFYFPNGHDLLKFIDILTYPFISKGIDDQVLALRRLKKRKNRPYLYQFCYSGKSNMLKPFTPYPTLEGACHGDDVAYIFSTTMVPVPALKACEEDRKTVEVTTKFITDFAKFGDPWPEMKEKTKDEDYIEINKGLQLKSNYQTAYRKFWNSINEVL